MFCLPISLTLAWYFSCMITSLATPTPVKRYIEQSVQIDGGELLFTLPCMHVFRIIRMYFE